MHKDITIIQLMQQLIVQVVHLQEQRLLSEMEHHLVSLMPLGLEGMV